jgi:hypothetical protein
LVSKSDIAFEFSKSKKRPDDDGFAELAGANAGCRNSRQATSGTRSWYLDLPKKDCLVGELLNSESS